MAGHANTVDAPADKLKEIYELLSEFVLPRLFAQRAHRELAWARHAVNAACVHMHV